MNNQTNQNPAADYKLGTLFYIKGAGNKVYWLDDGNLVLSQRTLEELLSENPIDLKSDKYRYMQLAKSVLFPILGFISMIIAVLVVRS